MPSPYTVARFSLAGARHETVDEAGSVLTVLTCPPEAVVSLRFDSPMAAEIPLAEGMVVQSPDGWLVLYLDSAALGYGELVLVVSDSLSVVGEVLHAAPSQDFAYARADVHMSGAIVQIFNDGDRMFRIRAGTIWNMGANPALLSLYSGADLLGEWAVQAGGSVPLNVGPHGYVARNDDGNFQGTFLNLEANLAAAADVGITLIGEYLT